MLLVILMVKRLLEHFMKKNCKKKKKKKNQEEFQIKKVINPHMHKMGPRGPKHCIFGDQFYWKKCQNAQIPWIPSFLSQKTYDMIILPEVAWIHKKFWILFLFSLGPWESIIEAKFRNFLEIWSNSGKIMITYVF